MQKIERCEIVALTDQSCIPPSEKPKPFERLVCNDDCRELLITKYKFPRLLFEKTWWEGNGFAGLRQYGADDPNAATISESIEQSVSLKISADDE